VAPNRLGYQPALHGIRAVAILLVVCRHAFQWPRGAFLGVDLFFVLSGFLITSLLLEEQAISGRIRLSLFYARRALRLLPALFAMLAAYIVVSVVTGADPGRIVGRAAIGASYTANIAAAWWPDTQHRPLRHLWSLAMEEQFYLIWPIALILVTRFVRRHLAAILSLAIVTVWLETVLLIAAGDIGHRVYMGPDTRSLPLLIGCFLAVARTDQLLPRLNRAVIFLAVSIGIACVLLVDSYRATAYVFAIPVFSIATGIVILHALQSPSLGRVLSWPPLVYLGLISYALYLWHPLTLLAVGSPAGQPAGLLRPAVGVLWAIALAMLSRVLVEQPFLRLKRRLQAKSRESLTKTELSGATVTV
jgi:peptidoglycan/LPS O-acetylase OafA/YrhL